MGKNRTVIMTLAIALLLGVVACKHSNNDNNQTVISGTRSITSIGGSSAEAVGGMGYMFVAQSNAQLEVLGGGSFAMPAVDVPATGKIITSDYTWTDADNGLIADGLYIAPGVTVTIPDTLADYDYGTYPGGIGMVVGVDGPVVIAGNIVSDSANTLPVTVSIVSVGADTTDNTSILVSGTVDLSGAPSSTGSGVQGGVIYFINDTVDDSPWGIYLAGAFASNGGDALGALNPGNGGIGGAVLVFSSDAADILVDADISANGGDAEGAGVGGSAGQITLINLPDSTMETSTGRISVYNLSGINDDGGDGFLAGGMALGPYLMSARSSVVVTAPISGNGGDATGPAGIGGPGMVTPLYAISNGLAFNEEDLIGNADMIFTAPISAVGGEGPFAGGVGGVAILQPMNGNLYVSNVVDLSGGDALDDDAGSKGGNGGVAVFNVISLVDGLASDNPFWGIVQYTILDGGEGGETGGNGGVYQFINQSPGWIYLPPAFLSNQGGTGTLADGLPGNITITGNAVAIPFFPTIDTLP